MRSSTCIFFMMVLALGLSLETLGQAKWSLEGSLIDDVSEQMPSATVVLLNGSDSTMVQFAITDKNGAFRFTKVDQGNYIVQSSYMGFQLKYTNVTLNSNLVLEPILMKKNEVMLDDISLATDRIPILLKGDTIQYNAEAFKTKPNSVVEDLLKKLPGVEVQADGSIKAQGETVNKVLVDGKEFFGDDPKMATKNLPADAIDKVQVFDKMSDLAEFTGVDDGNTSKTINLQLKEGAKAGYFGKSYLGGGYDPVLYEGKFNVNRFNKKSQMSFIGMGNNINEQGFSFDDYIQFMGGLSSIMSSAKGGMLTLDPGEMMGGMVGSDGITSTWAGGLNYNRDWAKKTEWRSSYFYNRIGTDLESQAKRIYSDTSALASAIDNTIQDSKGASHSINYSLKHKIDSSQDIKLQGNLRLNTGYLERFSVQQSLDEEGNNLNAFESNSSNDSEVWKTDAILTYRKRSKKAGRSFVGRGTMDLSKDSRFGSLVVDDNLAGNTNQIQEYSDSRTSFGARVNYTEPLPFGKGLFVESSLAYERWDNKLDKEFFDVQANDDLVKNKTFSNAFENQINQYSGRLKLQKSTKGFTGNIGVTLQETSQEGVVSSGSPILQNYTALLPSGFLRYKIGTGKNIRAYYGSDLGIPSLEQLQPLVDNSNPLRLYVGNPNLKASTQHQLRVNFMTYSQFSFTSFFVSLSGVYVDNAIQNSVTTDSVFRQVLSPVNVDNDKRLNGDVSFSTPIKALGIKIGLSGRESFMQSQLPINGVLNTLNRFTHSAGTYIENRKKETIDLRIGADLSYSNSTYSESKGNNQSYINTDYYIDAVVYTKNNWTIKSDFRYKIFASDNFDNTQAFPMWGASISKLFLKEDKGELSLRVSDMLNQNIGYSQSSQWNYLEEKTSNNLGRYVMLRFSYSLKGFGATAGPSGRKGHRGRGSWRAE